MIRLTINTIEIAVDIKALCMRNPQKLAIRTSLVKLCADRKDVTMIIAEKKHITYDELRDMWANYQKVQEWSESPVGIAKLFI